VCSSLILQNFLEFWLGTVFFSIATGLFLGISVRYEKKPALVSILLCSVFAYLISFLLFSVAKELLVVFVFYVLALIWCEEIIKTRLIELKKLPILRSGGAANLSDIAVELKVQSENALLEEIKNSGEFKALRESQSELDQNFVKKTDSS